MGHRINQLGVQAGYHREQIRDQGFQGFGTRVVPIGNPPVPGDVFGAAKIPFLPDCPPGSHLGLCFGGSGLPAGCCPDEAFIPPPSPPPPFLPPIVGPPGTPCPNPLHCRDLNGFCKDCTPGFDTPAELGPSMHQNGHSDTIPAMRDVRTRRCPRGDVLGKDGWCHPKRMIRNSDRAWPKPRRALGTPGDLNAVMKASRFGARLIANKKRLKKLEQNLKRATC